jgi:hypothetical protein
MKHIATLLFACLALAGCGDRSEEPSRFYEPPALY